MKVPNLVSQFPIKSKMTYGFFYYDKLHIRGGYSGWGDGLALLDSVYTMEYDESTQSWIFVEEPDIKLPIDNYNDVYKIPMIYNENRLK